MITSIYTKVINLLRRIDNRILFIALIYIIFFVSTYIILTDHTLYRLYNSDIYHQIAAIKEFDNYPNMGDPYFTEGPVDLHDGPYYFTLYMVSKIANIQIEDVLYMAVVYNIIFLCLALYFFGRSFNMNSRQVFIFVLISFLGWGGLGFFFAGIYDYTNLLVSGSFPATFGLSLLLLAMGVSYRYIILKNPILLVLATLLLTATILSHLLSGVVLVSFIALMLAWNIYKERGIRRYHIFLAGVIISSMLLSIFIWPPFGIIDVFLSSTNTVEVGTSSKVTDNLFALSYWPEIMGLVMLGLAFIPLLWRRKQEFIILIFVASAVMVVSYMLPIRVSLYWRYFPFLFLTLSFALAIGIGTLRRWSMVLILVTIVGVGGLNIMNRLGSLKHYEVSHSDTETLIEITKNVPRDAVVLSDPNTSYHLSAFHEQPVVSIPYNHGNPAYITPSKYRYEETMAFLTDNQSPLQQKGFLDKYKVGYVVINDYYYPDYIKLLSDRSWTEAFKLKVESQVIFKNDYLTIYRIP